MKRDRGRGFPRTRGKHKHADNIRIQIRPSRKRGGLLHFLLYGGERESKA